ncbi:hypothetical protein [Luminiphilus sp. nBUS_07]|uniref:hypothetical protein n=1 Tax=Luminiphilus sp. nBUS_07 TaxID=3395314 RepID=UPI003EBD5F9D|nr:hypothetical protein [Luminiphilus sp.]
MRGLAEFIMRGRWQALAVAVVGAGSLLFGWLSAAAIALVTLRKGIIDGSWLVLWALLPALLAAWMSGDIGSIVLLAGTFVLAVILRTTVSLALAILASAALGILGGAGLLLISGEFLDQLVVVFAELIGDLEANMKASGETITLPRPTPGQVAGILAAGNAVTAVLSLLLARYWQALLYNPGGFRVEFHRLRLPVGATLILGGLAIFLWLQASWISGWAMVWAVPLMFAGFALVHAWVAFTRRGNGSLVAFYAMWLFLDPVKGLLLGLVMADALLDFRRRWSSASTDGEA